MIGADGDATLPTMWTLERLLSHKSGWNVRIMLTKSLLWKDLKATSRGIYERAQSAWPSPYLNLCLVLTVPDRAVDSLGLQAPGVKIQQS